MKKWLLIVALCLMGGGFVQAACGDNQAVCGEEERCCTHQVASFCEGQACSSMHTEGACVPKNQGCGDFWCGNRQCETSWLITRDVCCIYYPTGSTPEYACAASEFSCRGNTGSVPIRQSLAARENQNGG